MTHLLEPFGSEEKLGRQSLGDLAGPFEDRVARLTEDGFVSRFWDRDPSLWSLVPQGQVDVKRRLGWLDSPQAAQDRLRIYRDFAGDVRASGISRFLVLGMGGSSVAAEVLADTVGEGQAGQGVVLSILDSTHPDQVLQAARDFPPESSLYIVSSKSGGTAEVMAMFEFFWKATGGDGSRFAAVSDEGTSLQTLAQGRRFRRSFVADATVGGRYSALTDFGMVPAALLGIGLAPFVERAVSMRRECGREVPPERNPGVALGALLAEAAMRGRDKLTLFADPELEALPHWIEQLVAESSGKDGKGILPVAAEPADAPSVYGEDRLFVYLRRSGQLDDSLEAIQITGHPAITLPVPDGPAVAAEFFRWEVAVATACHILGVNAFDQPDVQESKDRTGAKIEELRSHGAIEEGEWDIEVKSAADVEHALSVLWPFLRQGRPGEYVAITAYLPRRGDMIAELQRLRVLIRERTHLATAVGFGPRFQHSTGQYHKGGPNSGLFVQIVSDPDADAAIPGADMTFGDLMRAQALGDYETLMGRGRRVIRVHLDRPASIIRLRRLANEQIA